SESLAAAANIFMGQTEAALVVKPYLAGMTSSEVMALMTTGMATIASGVMVVYVQMGVSAGHILTASVMSAPAALLIAKIMLLATYALCGFANFASIAIQIGGIGSLAPTRRSDLARLGFRAMIGGLLASYLTSTIAGILI